MKEKLMCLANAIICTAVASAVSSCSITPEIGAVVLIPTGLLACSSFVKTDWCTDNKKALADTGLSTKRKTRKI